MKRSKQRSESAYTSSQTVDALTSGPNRAADHHHYANMRCWLLLMLSLLPVSLLLLSLLLLSLLVLLLSLTLLM